MQAEAARVGVLGLLGGQGSPLCQLPPCEKTVVNGLHSSQGGPTEAIELVCFELLDRDVVDACAAWMRMLGGPERLNAEACMDSPRGAGEPRARRPECGWAWTSTGRLYRSYHVRQGTSTRGEALFRVCESVVAS